MQQQSGEQPADSASLDMQRRKSVSNRWTGKSDHLWPFFGLLAQVDVRNPSDGLVRHSGVSRLVGKKKKNGTASLFRMRSTRTSLKLTHSDATAASFHARHFDSFKRSFSRDFLK